MSQSKYDWHGQLKRVNFLVLSGAAILALNERAIAQVIPDNTLGSESSVIDPQTESIKGGAQRGDNLFHSFREFNIGEGRAIYFANPDGVRNIFSRVTGTNASNILGKLGVMGNANLFFMNPNGIIFGPNASLDIRGSFLASSANSLLFADGTQFSATAPQATPLLTISVPIGLQFGETVGEIQVQRSRLAVNSGKTLALVGGEIVLKGGNPIDSKNPQPNLVAPGGRIELGSVAGVGQVSLYQSGDDWVLGYDRINTFKNVRLEDGAFVDASGNGGGSIQIQGARLDLSQRSWIFADTQGTEAGGEVLVRTSEAVTLRGGSLITTNVLETATGTGGSITIETGQLSIQEASLISTSTAPRSKGSGGSLVVVASDSVQLGGIGSGFLVTGTQGAGDAGHLTIVTGRLSVQNGARVLTSTFSMGNAGDLAVHASEIELNGTGILPKGDLSAVRASEIVFIGIEILPKGNLYPSDLSTETNGEGKAGNLTITTRQLSVQNGAQIFAGTLDKGQGGKLSVTAESIELMGRSSDGQFSSGLFTQADSSGNAGNLIINTRQLIVGNGAQISAATFGQGKGGDIQVNATDLVNIFGVGSNRSPSGIFTRTSGEGKGGNIFVDTSSFRVADNAIVDARTFGAGTSGNITVKANTFEAISGGQILTSAFTGSRGSAGNITIIATDSVTISGIAPFNRLVRIGENQFVVGADSRNSRLFVRLVRIGENRFGEDESATSGLFVLSRGSGNAGEIDVTTRSLRLDNRGELMAENNSGNGGNITLQVQDLLQLRGGSKISTTAGLAGAGGNIEIDTKFLVATPNENSDISANAFEGRGGNITINTQGIFGLQFRENQTDLSDITVSSELGVAGIVKITSPEVDPNQGLVNLLVLLETTEVVQACSPSGNNTSEFTMTGRGGLPPTPQETLNHEPMGVDWVTLPSSSSTISKEPDLAPVSDRIIEAQGWIVDADGKVVLVAQADSSTHSWQKPVNCHDE